jgi:hypothetical protein
MRGRVNLPGYDAFADFIMGRLSLVHDALRRMPAPDRREADQLLHDLLREPPDLWMSLLPLRMAGLSAEEAHMAILRGTLTEWAGDSDIAADERQRVLELAHSIFGD